MEEHGTDKEAAVCLQAGACGLWVSDWTPITTQILTDRSGTGLSQEQRKRVLAGSMPLNADLMLAMDLLDDAVILLHEDGRIIQRNHAATVAGATMKSTGMHSLHMLGPEEPWAGCRQILREYQGRSGFLEREIRDPGSGRCWSLKLAALAYLGVTPRRLVLVVRDVTEAVRVRERLQEGEVMAATGALLAGAAHQTKNVIFGLSATLDAFEAHLPDNAIDNDYVKHLRQGIARMHVLMRDLLDYGNPLIRGETQTISLAASIRRSIGDCQDLAQASGALLSAEIFADAEVKANPARLTRALENLIENAIQHSPQQGKVTVRLATSGGSCAHLEVTDQGPGFAPQHMEQFFTPFFTLRPGGTGLGLTIAKRIIEDLGGVIRLSNGTGGGARATIFLPMTTEGPQESQLAFDEGERGGE